MAEQVGIKITAFDDTKAAFQSVGASLASIQSSAAGVSASLASLGVGISVGGFVALTKSIIDGLDAMNDLKDATGASIENISALEDIARRTGPSFDTVSTALVKMNQALNTAKPGSDAEKAINAIGLSVKDLKALDPAEAFRKIAIGLSGFADDANKARLTQELFGKSLKDVAPLLKDVAENGKLVGTITTEQTEAAEALNKQLFAFQANTLAASRAIVNELVPTLSQLAKEFTEADKSGGSLAKNIGEGMVTALEMAVRVGAGAAFVFKTIGREIGGMVAGLEALGEGGGIFTQKGRAAWLAVWDARKEDFNQSVKDYNDLVDRVSGARAPVAPKPTGNGAPSLPDIGGGPSAGDIAKLNTELKAQAKLLAELSGLTGSFADDWDALGKAYKRGALTVDQLTAAQAKLLAQQPFSKEAAKQWEEQSKASAKAIADLIKAEEQYNATLAKSAESVGNKVQDLEDEEKALALSAAQNITLAQAIEQVNIARLQEQILIEQKAGNQEGIDALAKEIKSRERLIELMGSKAARDATTDAAKKAADEWKKTADQLENLISDGLMRGFENGKGFAENFRDTLENVFKTMVLRPIIQATVQGALGIDGGSGGISGGVGGFVNGLSKAGNAFESLKFAATDFQGFSAFAAKDFGDALSKAGFEKFGDAFAQNANEIGAYAQQAGEILSYLEAASNFKDGSFGKSIGQGLGLYLSGGNPIFGQIGKELGSVLDRIFGGDQGPTNAGVNSSFDALGTLTGRVRPGNSQTSNASVDAFTSLLAVSYQQALTKFGATGKASTFGYQTTSDGKFDLSTTIGGAAAFQQGTTAYSPEALQLAASRAVFAALQGSELPSYLSKAFNGITANTATAEQIAGAYAFADSLKAVRFGLLTATEQQAEYQKIIDAGTASLGTSAATFRTDFIAAIDKGLTPETLAQWNALGSTMQALEQITGKTITGIATLDQTLAKLRNPSRTIDDIARSIVGLENAGKSLQVQLLDAQGDTTGAAALQRALDTAGFTDVEKALYDYNQGLRDQIDALAAAKTASDEVIAAAQAAAKATADERASLQNQLNALTDTNAEALARQRAALDESNRALFDQITAAQAAKTAAEALADAQAKAAADAKALADATAAQRNGLQDQLDQLTLSSTDLLAKQREALFASNRALFDQVQAAQAAKTAQQALADAQAKAAAETAAAAEQLAQRIASALGGLSDTRFGLENQLLTLQGNTGAVVARTRTNDLAKLTEGITSQSEIDRITAAYDYNASLKDQIAALEAAQKAAQESANAQEKAAQESARAAEQLKSAWQSVTDSIFEEVQRIRGLLGGGSAQTFAQAQANFSITAAQASAGDQTAAKNLPELSRILLDLAATNATSLLQLQVIQGQTAGTLEQIGKQFANQFGLTLPKLSTGTNFVPQDMAAILHKGEAVVPAAYNPANNPGAGNSNDALIAEVQALRQEIADLKSLQSTNNDSAKITADTLRRVTRGGDAMQTQVFV